MIGREAVMRGTTRHGTAQRQGVLITRQLFGTVISMRWQLKFILTNTTRPWMSLGAPEAPGVGMLYVQVQYGRWKWRTTRRTKVSKVFYFYCCCFDLLLIAHRLIIAPSLNTVYQARRHAMPGCFLALWSRLECFSFIFYLLLQNNSKSKFISSDFTSFVLFGTTCVLFGTLTHSYTLYLFSIPTSTSRSIITALTQSINQSYQKESTSELQLSRYFHVLNVTFIRVFFNSTFCYRHILLLPYLWSLLFSHF